MLNPRKSGAYAGKKGTGARPLRDPNKPAKRLIRNERPSAVLTNADLDEIRIEFGRRLDDLMVKKGWNGAETARRATMHMPIDDATREPMPLGRDLISKYRKGRGLPMPTQLTALCKAFGVEPEDLVPSRGHITPQPPATLEVKAHDDDSAWVRINQRLPWKIAIQIQELVTKNKLPS